ncbi:hypothetical protein, partial [Methylobacterium nigriterrae]|uniref:hypothetical protein n=1 Tax=Methylobacterium nigriterrae TaxID=3127512 RepID=UPI0030140392
ERRAGAEAAKQAMADCGAVSGDAGACQVARSAQSSESGLSSKPPLWWIRRPRERLCGSADEKRILQDRQHSSPGNLRDRLLLHIF